MSLFIALMVLFGSSTLWAAEATSRKGAVASSSRFATSIGVKVLRDGGNAVDAAVAVAFALSVAYPQSSVLGGGGIAVYYDRETDAVWTLDFLELTPYKATPEGLNAASNGAKGDAAHLAATSAGVPGAVAGLAAMHKRFGTRSWSELIAPAIDLARYGFPVSPQLASAFSAAASKRGIDHFPTTAAVFFPDGKPIATGATLRQKDLGDTLARIAAKGSVDFYSGVTAARIAEATRTSGGLLAARDFTEYEPLWRAPIEIQHSGVQIYAPAPPSTGAVFLADALRILGRDKVGAMMGTPLYAHLIAETERRARLDVDHYVGDPAFLRIPYKDLFSDERARMWRSSIDPARASDQTTLEATSFERDHTTHFVVADSKGNLLSMTTSLGESFGSGWIADGTGVLMNSALAPYLQPHPGLGLIGPKRRLSSDLSPIVVLRDHKPFFAAGTAGGTAIPDILLQLILGVTSGRQTLNAAVTAPRWWQSNAGNRIFYEPAVPRLLIDRLTEMGHAVEIQDAIGDVQAVMISGNEINAVSDPRYGGAAGGY
ncbi:MAG TPA: gamma-glutamyltransferase [Thermoanaerobaculia bacterium]|nr:gamma-glutamyltransferase [Thermoanaerobaculia bacterium]